MLRLLKYFTFFYFSFFSTHLSAQGEKQIPLISLDMPDTLHKKRFWVLSGTSATICTGFSIGLWNAWYKNYDIGKFHFFDDRGEWEGMDKAGHFHITYNEARWLFNGARWTGMDRKKAAWTGAGVAFGLQMTIEMMDGFSEKWGFSPADVLYNTLGAGLFIGQEYLWEEQRIVMKISSNRINYPDFSITDIDGSLSTTLSARADDLYGTSFAQRFLKDYNAQTIWASANIHSFLKNKDSKFPKWLNVAVGFGAENMYAGYGYDFVGPEGGNFRVDAAQYPRYNQAYLSLDVDFTRIPTKSRLLQTVFSVINFIKIPAPALEYNRINGLQFHPVHW